MPDPSTHAVPSLRPDRPASATALTLRLAVGTLFALSALLVPQLSSPEPAAAGSSCTGWTSTAVPPKSIRVLRTRSGKVETVPFRKYVARVMASGEWPSRLKMATLEAGALATKQYAWYYAMKGNHRSGYALGSSCYDVRDDTRDQLYKHYVSPTDRQWKAVDKTWGLTLRKNGRFFLTGYRAGVSRTCGADANGWKLYAASVEACARQGWSYTRILKKYLSPRLEFVWSDKIGPIVSPPKVRLKGGNTLASGAATVSWRPVPAKTEVVRYKVQRKASGGVWKDVELPRLTARSVDSYLKVDVKSRFRVKAKDAKGNWGRWAYSDGRRASVRGPVGTTIAGGVGTAAVTTQRVKSRFSGKSVAVVARTGPGMGVVKIFINGKRQAIVDLERQAADPRKLVWARNFKHAGPRTIAVKPIGTRERVDFNGFYVLR